MKVRGLGMLRQQLFEESACLLKGLGCLLSSAGLLEQETQIVGAPPEVISAVCFLREVGRQLLLYGFPSAERVFRFPAALSYGPATYMSGGVEGRWAESASA